MMELSSKSFRKPFIAAALFASSCYGVNKPIQHKCEAIVVLDKTNSVSYSKRLPQLGKELTGKLLQTYDLSTQCIQCSRFTITGNTEVFPTVDHFDKVCPIDDGSRTSHENWLLWQMAKKKWVYDEVKMVDSLITSPCISNTTDIFSIFSGFEQVQQSGAPWDSINVFIFSDMVNTTGMINMAVGLNANNARNKGKSVYQKLLDQGRVTTGNTDNLYLTIYTPDSVNNSEAVYQFWQGFFAQWGLSKSHYKFVK
jgi:hypothetical protein